MFKKNNNAVWLPVNQLFSSIILVLYKDYKITIIIIYIKLKNWQNNLNSKKKIGSFIYCVHSYVKY